MIRDHSRRETGAGEREQRGIWVKRGGRANLGATPESFTFDTTRKKEGKI
jgi:hypothetical protein